MSTTQDQQRFPPILEVESLSRTVDGQHLTNAVSLSLHPGEIIAILGPSGSGKSSFLRLINRLDEPTNGHVRLKGSDYTAISPQHLRQQVGMVMQAPFLFPGTVAENIRFGPAQRGEEILPRRIDTLLDEVGLAGYADRDISTLSGGEAQRVSFLRTLANDPCVLLLDETTSALDEISTSFVERLITRVTQENHVACLMITHSKEQAHRMADRVMIIVDGAVAALATPEEII
jgi:putative ABC transport system ATP-binding protein